ncbi:MAG: DEAD/DEAH box helicase [Candidatus Scalindua sp. AMX11]|nr:MAG: ATP-dependent helicase [Candidatus Scalindua sp.]NOG85553.1 DEAD/DEAH box helicase [Planctomycetota bacterium]RZV90198.1 MAG: DEAD/DEAH box helicase [Candidatus Scalindua sp. SCAELEC01]TDE64982.1 MAG: DEAD/DEAH box helicase [Candidatus Scalindua sp. AMX11]GJQ59583.1 MAG: helicase [Candidatus Scalindua sp.]
MKRTTEKKLERKRRDTSTPNKQKKKSTRLRVSKTHKPEELGLEEWQRILRKQFAEQQNFRLNNSGDHPFFSEFSLTNPETEKTYKLAIRGDTPGDNFCSCPDFRINNLGTCKHIEFALFTLKKKRGAKKAFGTKNGVPFSEVYLHYGLKREVKFRAGKELPMRLSTLVEKFFDANNTLKDTHILQFHQFLNNTSQANGHEVRCYDDVMSFIAEHQDAVHRAKIVKSQLKGGVKSPLFNNILKTKLYPYQKEGALFAVKAGRSLIGDDMGLGKTIQALTAAELMVKLFRIKKVLIVSPTSLKHQWKAEIEKFCGRSSCVIEGLNDNRQQLYREESFYKLVNYELVYRDSEYIRSWSPDLIILDEAQRIKNWRTRTAKCVKQLDSPFAIVLTGTPIENRIEELHSIMEFIDRHHLGPLYRFVQMHRILDNDGKVIGYKGLQSIRGTLKNVLIRRKKGDVLKQLPDRIDKNFFVPMTKEQSVIHDENYDIVVRLVAKWRRYKFLCEADQRRLQIALNFMRMAADNTYLVDKKTIHGPKLDELEVIVKELVQEGGEKAVIFSQWLRMTELVENVLTRNGIKYVHLNGSVPSKKRKGLISQFKEDLDCKVFLSTDAGGVGLNLQSGSVVINMDIPWNPAVLEQRIGRVHRLGQKRSVRVINFVSSSSIESRILELLKFKKSLFAGALDAEGEDVVMVGESQIKRFVKTVETVTETLEKSDPAVEEKEKREAEKDYREAELKELAEENGKGHASSVEEYRGEVEQLGNLLQAGAQFLTHLSEAITGPAASSDKNGESLLGKDEKSGKAYLKIPLPEKEVVGNIFSALGKLLSKP